MIHRVLFVLAVLGATAYGAPRPPAPPSARSTTLSPRFQKALTFASQLHKDQLRKGTTIPYVSHLIQVAGLVLEHGGTETQAIAALLHDAVEDQGGARTLARIRRRFGPEVASIVSEVTEIPGSWRERKEHKIHKIASGQMSQSGLLVKLADNLHNARSMVEDSRQSGPAFWDRFSGGRDGTLWYYRSLVKAYRKAGVESPLENALERTVRQLGRAR